MLTHGRDGSEAAAADRTPGGSTNSMVLRMQLELLECLERQTALVAAILVDVSLGHGQLLTLGVDLSEMNLQSGGRAEVLVASLLPAEVAGAAGRLLQLQVA